MDQNPFAPPFDTLPDSLPVFPLLGVLLMPFGQLPLNIFEPRYVEMVNDALKTHRLIGMIQPKVLSGEDKDELYDTGCAGKITEFSEMSDGSYTITLTGLCRFKIKTELRSNPHYRNVHPDWSLFEKDLDRKACLKVDRERLQSLLLLYFDQESMSCDFSKFENLPDGQLMTCLSMVCPFEPYEKQALLELACCVERAQLFMRMLEMAIEERKCSASSQKHCH